MRWVLVTALVIAPTIAAAAPQQSNPAFLGVGFDQNTCMVDSVTPGGAASNAGIESGDVIVAFEQQPVSSQLPCDQLIPLIVAHHPGDRVRLDVIRANRPIVVTVTLSSRAEVVQKRIGSHIAPTVLVDADDVRHSYDLSEHHDQTTIVGWFAKGCSSCATVFDRLHDRLRKRLRGTAPTILAVESYNGALKDEDEVKKDLAALRKDFSSSVPLAVADERTVDVMSMLDKDRVFLMVIDCRGIVQLVAPVAPDADDFDAALDDVLAAAEQAEHARTSRR